MEKRTKLVTVVRADLNMPKGKMVSQGQHGLQYYYESLPGLGYRLAHEEWSNDGHSTKITLKVKSEEDLMAIYHAARQAGIPAQMVVDNGVTMFNGVKTVTAIVLGPDWNEKLDPLTSHLSLL
jgi:peptidyl-tRNA hydrolase, PTH2 family